MTMQTIKEGLIKRIHVNQHNIRHNQSAAPKDLRPVFTVKTSDKNWKAHNVEILGESHMVYSPDKPLSCGARVWMETTAAVRVTTAEA